MPKKNAPETVTFAFRLTKTEREWLEETARLNGVEASQVARWALEALRQYVTEHDGRLHLPIDIKQFWVAMTKTQPKLVSGEQVPSLRMNESSEATWKTTQRGGVEGQAKSPSAKK